MRIFAAGCIKIAFDISDVWPSSYSTNTNEILWGAKVGARVSVDHLRDPAFQL